MHDRGLNGVVGIKMSWIDVDTLTIVMIEQRINLQVLPKPLKKRESARSISAMYASAADTNSDGTLSPSSQPFSADLMLAASEVRALAPQALHNCFLMHHVSLMLCPSNVYPNVCKS